MKRYAFIGSLLAAWDLLLDIPLPAAWRRFREDGSDPQWTLLSMPAIGCVLSAAILVLGRIYGEIFTLNGAALMFALSAVLFLDARDSGRGLGLLLTLAAQMFRRVPLAPLLPRLRPFEQGLASDPVPTAVVAVLEIFKVCSLFLLYRHGAGCWLVAVLVLSFSIQGSLMCLPNLDTGSQFLDVSRDEQSRMWIVCVFLMLFVALKLPLSAIAGTGCAVAFAWIVGNAAWRTYGGISAEMITLAGAVAELGLLLVGFLFAG